MNASLNAGVYKGLLACAYFRWEYRLLFKAREAMLLPTGLNGVSTQEEVLRGTILQSLVATYVFGTPGTQSWL